MEKKLIGEWCKKNRYSPWFYGNNPSIFIMGESHWKEEDYKKQEEMMDFIKPKSILLESLDVRIIDPATKEVKFLPDIIIDGNDESFFEMGCYPYELKWSEKYRAPLVGIDLSFAEEDKIEEETGEEYISSDLNKYKNTKECFYREKRMAYRIIEYHNKGLSPLVAVVGNTHIRSKSAIHSILQTNNLSYCCINQQKRRNFK